MSNTVKYKYNETKKGKRTKKQKKIGLTNVISYLNLLYNADKEKRKQPRKNLMLANPYKYPSLISDANLNNIWKATRLPASRSRRGMVSNINNVYQQFLANDLIHGSGSRADPIRIQAAPLGSVANPVAVD